MNSGMFLILIGHLWWLMSVLFRLKGDDSANETTTSWVGGILVGVGIIVWIV